MNDKILGFELIQKGENLFAGLEKVSMSVIFTKNPGGTNRKLEMSITGINIDTEESVEWLNKEIKLGDEFIIKVKESDAISIYRIKEKPLPHAEVLAKMSEEEKQEMKLRRFKHLEEKLKFKGLI